MEYLHLVFIKLISQLYYWMVEMFFFLGMDLFDHDLSNIVNTVQEDDRVYGLKGLHEVRKSISRKGINVEETLSPYVINKYSGLEFWRNND